MARTAKLEGPEAGSKPKISAASWALLAALAGTALLLYTGLTTGEWRGVVVSEVQIVVVALAAWLALHGD